LKDHLNQVINLYINNFMLDCECVAWDKDANKPLPFQILTTRKRENVLTKDIKISVCLFSLGLLYLNDIALINKSFAERGTALHENFLPVEHKFHFASSRDF
jgi:DNA ligase-1